MRSGCSDYSNTTEKACYDYLDWPRLKMQSHPSPRHWNANRPGELSEVTDVIAALRSRPDVRSTIDRFDEMALPVDLNAQPLPLAIVPGAFYREYPANGADGTSLLEAASKLGMDAHRIPVPSFCGVKEGAQCVFSWLRQWRGAPVLLLSLSKGASDVAALFSGSEGPLVLGKVRGWVSVSGILTGTPLVNYIDQSLFRRLYIRLLLRLLGYRYQDLLSLKWSGDTDPTWCSLPELPFPVIHLMALPEQSELSSNLSRRAYRRLLSFGASDGGGVLLKDLLRYPGCVIPLSGQDHYMRKANPEDLLRRLVAMLLSDKPKPVT